MKRKGRPFFVAAAIYLLIMATFVVIMNAAMGGISRDGVIAAYRSTVGLYVLACALWYAGRLGLWLWSKSQEKKPLVSKEEAERLAQREFFDPKL